MKIVLLNIFLVLSLSIYGQAKITFDELKDIIGNWEGSITYLDYQTNKPYSMPANLKVTQGKRENILLLNNIYPNEPKANNFDKIKLTKNGMQLNKKTVTTRKILDNGHLQIQTEHQAKDDNKKALIRYTYNIGKDVFLVRKEVQFKEADNWIKRSEYKYQRKM
ncbi:outer membrane lipoprotein LolB [Portibacter lacus]|uniref:Uncharacterized protein n=1 Tax=Portibacter lacus TaxID=1099794 RepID=A0AA37ST23_9BACT|nr:outer membrane lipoprotein LolB [Portibacter lacus]GLR19898.1 hypothetical protein GCM10007940_45140 [Portibacter lacus]